MWYFRGGFFIVNLQFELERCEFYLAIQECVCGLQELRAAFYARNVTESIKCGCSASLGSR